MEEMSDEIKEMLHEQMEAELKSAGKKANWIALALWIVLIFIFLLSGGVQDMPSLFILMLPSYGLVLIVHYLYVRPKIKKRYNN